MEKKKSSSSLTTSAFDFKELWMNCTGSCAHVGTCDAISELGLAVQHPQPTVADVLIPLTASHINPGSQWSKSI